MASPFVGRWRSRLAVDGAVGWGLLGPARAMMFGPVIALLIATRLDADTQGYFYAFASLIGIQVLADLGLAQVVINFASHEAEKAASTVGAEADEARSRLQSLTRLAFGWYAIGSCLLAAALAVAGPFFFSGRHDGVAWLAPWLFVAVALPAKLLTLPVLAILEGVGEVQRVNRYRAIEGGVFSLFTCVSLVLGGGLWTMPISTAATVVCGAAFAISVRARFRELLRKPDVTVVAWRAEIWPLQWRLAVTWIAGFILYSVFVPVLFRVRGPVAAGQLGLTWSTIQTLGGLWAVWTYSNAPGYGHLVARQDFVELDRRWRSVTQASLVVAVVSTVAFVLALVGLDAVWPSLGDRFMSPAAALVLATGRILEHVVASVAIYGRAHKRELLFWQSLVTTFGVIALGVPLTVLAGGMGISAAYCGVLACFAVPAAFVALRRLRD